MRTDENNRLNPDGAWRRLPVEWLEPGEAQMMVVLSPGRGLGRPSRDPAWPPLFMARRPVCASRARGFNRFSRAFTILELMIVIAIIGLLAGLALPRLSGFTKGNTMIAATQQMLSDVALARQRAMVNRSEVCMVFLPPNFWMSNLYNGAPSGLSNNQITTLVGHQYAAYALISTRTVGDQPGRSNVHYVTDWRYLPQGIYIYPWQLTNGSGTNWVYTTNTTVGRVTTNFVTAFTNNIMFPFPSTYSQLSNELPYIGFSPNGQLVTGSDQYIALTSGSFFPPLNVNGQPQWAPGTPNATGPVETPPGQSTNNANLIHIDWLTARAKLEHNQF